MKKGFTMIELIFVIVILGILAAVAIPRLAATRDDATLAGIKTDVTSAMQAVPAWYQGQKDARIMQAIQLDSTKWKKGDAGQEAYTWSDGGAPCVTLAVYDINGTDANATAGTTPATIGTGTSFDIDTTNGAWIGGGTGATVTNGVPYFRVLKGKDGTLSGASTVCTTLWNDMGLSEANITMAGKKVQW